MLKTELLLGDLIEIDFSNVAKEWWHSWDKGYKYKITSKAGQTYTIAVLYPTTGEVHYKCILPERIKSFDIINHLKLLKGQNANKN